jgi:hypothetical protein
MGLLLLSHTDSSVVLERVEGTEVGEVVDDDVNAVMSSLLGGRAVEGYRSY